MTGRFVVFEGLDGAGTTTQLGLLADWLAGRGVATWVTREPSSGPVGAVLRRAIDGEIELDPVTLALAFAADRSDHLRDPEEGILISLDRGAWVLCDRYVISSLAYQSGQGLDLDWLSAINRFARPADLTVFIDTPPEECLRRIEARGVPGIFHGADRLRRTLAGYRSALAARTRFAGRLVEIDGTGSPEEVFDRLMAVIRPWAGEV